MDLNAIGNNQELLGTDGTNGFSMADSLQPQVSGSYIPLTIDDPLPKKDLSAPFSTSELPKDDRFVLKGDVKAKPSSDVEKTYISMRNAAIGDFRTDLDSFAPVGYDTSLPGWTLLKEQAKRDADKIRYSAVKDLPQYLKKAKDFGDGFDSDSGEWKAERLSDSRADYIGKVVASVMPELQRSGSLKKYFGVNTYPELGRKVAAQLSSYSETEGERRVRWDKRSDSECIADAVEIQKRLNVKHVYTPTDKASALRTYNYYAKREANAWDALMSIPDLKTEERALAFGLSLMSDDTREEAIKKLIDERGFDFASKISGTANAFRCYTDSNGLWLAIRGLWDGGKGSVSSMKDAVVHLFQERKEDTELTLFSIVSDERLRSGNPLLPPDEFDKLSNEEISRFAEKALKDTFHPYIASPVAHDPYGRSYSEWLKAREESSKRDAKDISNIKEMYRKGFERFRDKYSENLSKGQSVPKFRDEDWGKEFAYGAGNVVGYMLPAFAAGGVTGGLSGSAAIGGLSRAGFGALMGYGDMLDYTLEGVTLTESERRTAGVIYGGIEAAIFGGLGFEFVAGGISKGVSGLLGRVGVGAGKSSVNFSERGILSFTKDALTLEQKKFLVKYGDTVLKRVSAYSGRFILNEGATSIFEGGEEVFEEAIKHYIATAIGGDELGVDGKRFLGDVSVLDTLYNAFREGVLYTPIMRAAFSPRGAYRNLRDTFGSNDLLDGKSVMTATKDKLLSYIAAEDRAIASIDGSKVSDNLSRRFILADSAEREKLRKQKRFSELSDRQKTYIETAASLYDEVKDSGLREDFAEGIIGGRNIIGKDGKTRYNIEEVEFANKYISTKGRLLVALSQQAYLNQVVSGGSGEEVEIAKANLEKVRSEIERSRKVILDMGKALGGRKAENAPLELKNKKSKSASVISSIYKVAKANGDKEREELALYLAGVLGINLEETAEPTEASPESAETAEAKADPTVAETETTGDSKPSSTATESAEPASTPTEESSEATEASEATSEATEEASEPVPVPETTEEGPEPTEASKPAETEAKPTGVDEDKPLEEADGESDNQRAEALKENFRKAKSVAKKHLSGQFFEADYLRDLHEAGVVSGDVVLDSVFAKLVLLDTLFDVNYFGDTKVEHNHVFNTLLNCSKPFAEALLDSAYILAHLHKTEWGHYIISAIPGIVDYWNAVGSLSGLDVSMAEDVYSANMVLLFSSGTPDEMKSYFAALLSLNAFLHSPSGDLWNGVIIEDIPYIANTLTEKFKGTALADFVERLVGGDKVAFEEVNRLLSSGKDEESEAEAEFNEEKPVETEIPDSEKVSKAVNSERVAAPNIDQVQPESSSADSSEPNDSDSKERFVSKVESLLGEEKLDVRSLRKLKDEFGLSELNDIEMQELVELAIVRKARGIIESGREDGLSRKEIFDKITALYEAQPVISMRSSGRVEKQQYSTPIPMSFLASEFVFGGLSGKENPIVLEPSAGNGMMVIGLPQRYVHVNDIDNTRKENLNRQSFAKVSGQDALVPFSMRYDGVVTNPPFGKLEKVDVDGYKIGGLERRMSLNALDSMKDDGRAAIIIGGNAEYESNGALKRVDDKAFFNYLYSHYNVVDVINISGDLYSRQGTSYPTRMILISGRKEADNSFAPIESEANAGAVESFEALFERFEGLSIPEASSSELPVVRKTVQERVEQEAESTVEKQEEKPKKSSKKREKKVSSEDKTEDSSGTSESKRDDSAPKPVVEQVKSQVVQRNSDDAPIDLKTEKVSYPVQSFGREIGSVVPANMAVPVRDNLRELGDVDAFVANKLGYKSKEELYGALSAEQIDGVAMAIVQLETPRGVSKLTGKTVNFGFVNGDMTGVGKGRQAAALIRYAVLRGLKPVFVTEKAALFSDIYRDLRDIGSADLIPFIFNNNATANITDESGKVVYKHASAAELNAAIASGKLPDKANFVCTTYSQFNFAKTKDKRSLLSAVSSDSIVILDESHNASGSSNTGEFFLEIVENARGVAFFSGTFAKRPDNMPLYSSVSNLSASGLSKDELVEAVNSGGVPLQEVMSEELVRSGQMIRRERDMTGVSIDWILIEKNAERLEDAYDGIAELFNDIIDFQRRYVEPALAKISKSLARSQGTASGRRGTKDMGISNTPFASKTFNLVRQLMFALKAEEVADRAIMHANAGLKPVIAVANTMEGFIEDEYGGVGAEADAFEFSASLLPGLDSVLRYTEKDDKGNKVGKVLSLSQLGSDGSSAYAELKNRILSFSAGIPLSPIDEIKNRLREAGLTVAEMTGRKTEIVKTDSGKLKVVPRSDKDGKKNARDFNSGAIDVLIINQSASTGISLHASSKFKDQRQRVMIFAQNQLDINTEVQMRGRTDRTGQVHRSRYEYIVSSIPAELRLLMMFKMKLKSLDANTTSSQKSKLNEMDVVDFMNVYGDKVVWDYCRENPHIMELIHLKPIDEDESADESADAPEGFASKILGRVALLDILGQRSFYEEVTERYLAKIEEVNAAGENVLEISEIPLNAELVGEPKVFIKGAESGSKNPFAGDVIAETLNVDVLSRPLSARDLERAMEMFASDVRLSGRFNYGDNGDAYSAAVKAVWLEQDQAIYNERKKKIEEDGLVELELLYAAERTTPSFSKLSAEEQARKLEIVRSNWEHNQNFRLEKLKRQTSGRFRGDQNILIQRFPLGSVVAIPEVLKAELINSSTPYSVGMFLGWKLPKKGKLVPSNMRAVFAVLDGRRKVEIPLSNVKLLEAISSRTNIARVYERGNGLDTTLDTWDSKRPNNTRENVIILTGNILRGKGQVSAGKLVRFTMKGGERRTGILMPKNWKPGKVAALAIEQKEYILSGEKVLSADGNIVFRVIHGVLKIGVPVSKQKGGKYYLNEKIRSFVRGGEFMQQGSLMVAEVLPDRVDDMLECLSNDMSVRVIGKGDTAAQQARYQRAFVSEDSSRWIEPEDIKLLAERVRDFVPGARVSVVSDAEFAKKTRELSDEQRANAEEWRGIRYQRGYVGDIWSERAEQAMEEGRFPAAELARRFGVSPEAISQSLPNEEYHHIGEDFEVVYFFNPDDFAPIEAKDIANVSDATQFLYNTLVFGHVNGVIPKKNVVGITRQIHEDWEFVTSRPNGPSKIRENARVAFVRAIESFNRGEISIGELQNKASEFKRVYFENKAALESEYKELLKKHKDVLKRYKRVVKKQYDYNNHYELRYLRDERGEVYGYYDPDTKEVVVREGARVDTLLHELGWHAVWDWSRENAPELHEKMREYVRNAPESVKSFVRENYPELDEESEKFADEVGAALFSAEYSGKVEEFLKTQKEKSWWAKLKRLFARAWEAMSRAFGFDEVDAGTLGKRDYESAIEALADAFVSGKRLKGESLKLKDVSQGVEDGVRLNRHATRVLFQRARAEAEDLKPPKADDWQARFDEGVAQVFGFDTYSDMEKAWKNNVSRALERAVIERMRRDEARAKAHEAESKLRIRKGASKHGTAVTRAMVRLKIPGFGTDKGGIIGWADRVHSILQKHYSERVSGEEKDLYILGLFKQIVIPSYTSASVNTLQTADAMEAQALMDKLLSSEALDEALAIAGKLEELIKSKASDKLIEEKRADLLNMLKKYGVGKFNARKLLGSRTAQGLSEFFLHELYQRNRDLETGNAEAFEEAVANANNDLSGAQSEEQERKALMRLNAAKLFDGRIPISKMGDSEILALSEAIADVLSNGIVALEESRKAVQSATRLQFGDIVSATLSRAAKKLQSRVKDKKYRNVIRFAYTLRDKFDVLVGGNSSARDLAKKLSIRISEADLNVNRMITEDSDKLKAALSKAFGVPVSKVGMKEVALLCKRRDGSERFSLYGEKLTDGQLISLYCQIRQLEHYHLFADMTEEEVEALSEDGRKLYSQWEMKEELEAFLGENLTTFGKELGKILHAHSAEIDAETYKDCGMPLSYKDSDEYFPIVRENERLDFMRDESIGAGQKIPVIPKFLTPRSHAYKPIDETSDVLELFNRRVFDVAHYVSFAGINREIRELSNGKDYESFRSSIAKLMGSSFTEDFSKHLRDIVSGRMAGSDIYDTAGEVRSTIMRRSMWIARCVALGYNVISGLKQAVGGIATMGIHAGLGKLRLQDMVLNFSNQWALAKELYNSQGYKMRYGDAVSERMRTLGRHLTKYEFLGRVPSWVVSSIVFAEQSSMIFSSLGDRIPMFVSVGYYGLLKEKYYSQGLSEEEATEKAQAEFFIKYDECQQAKSVQGEDSISRGRNQYMKQGLQFVTAPLQMMSRLVKSFEDFVENRTVENFKEFFKYAVYSTIIEPAAMYGATAFVEMCFKSGDDEEEFEYDALQHVLAITSAIPLIGSSLELVTSKRYSTSVSASPSSEILARGIYRGGKFAASLFDGKDGSSVEALDKLFKTVSVYNQLDKYVLSDEE